MLIKEVSNSSGKLDEQQVEDLITARKRTERQTSEKQFIAGHTYRQPGLEKKEDSKTRITPTVSLLTPYGKDLTT